MDRDGTELLLFRISEANRMCAEHWDHLITLDNDLEEVGRRLFLISLHQTDACASGKQRIDMDPMPQIRGRFRLLPHHFTGLLWARPAGEMPLVPSDMDQLSDVELALNEYDILEWPPGSGVTYSQYFAPKAFANGWRLRNEYEAIKNEVKILREEAGLPPVAAWPMKTFETFVYLVLVRIAGEDPNFTGLTPALIRQALLQSGYLALELSRAPKGKK